ncbi:MAG: hypothetical protein K6E73_10595 [Bacteroidales bacterium]|nr:hypothetical protein [Bacteroidales bacterium]
MSRLRAMLELDASGVLLNLADSTLQREESEHRGFICPHCHGGGHVIEPDEANVLEQRQCPTCMGFGQLKARITVQWMPDEKALRP